MREYISEMLKRKDLLIYLVKSGLKAEHRNSYLGYFWWLLDPLLNVLVYYFLVVIILGRGSENFNYAVFLVIGLVSWRWISTTLNGSARSITKYSSIINQVYLPKAIFPMTTTFSQMFNFSFGLIVVAIFLAIFNVIPGWHVIFLPIIILVQLLFLMAVSMFLSYICVFIRDIDNLISHVVRITFYSSPIIWEGGRLPAEYKWVVDMNPVAVIINSYRDILMFHRLPDFSGLLIISLISLVIIFLLILFYKKNEHKIIKAL
ncbi:ABC transporter permease [Evansella sp. AB-P1]|uniref:ABC transporter permease n=1 Tax=Evansella sp. AB-P1 TaxID=3037653 RepID=UPI00241DA23A|nr:ABC transporter permease [Evansella sp. AB-P1]MDG5786701.1 ABC transporter permease [Evansella sp. AB-P1]